MTFHSGLGQWQSWHQEWKLKSNTTITFYIFFSQRKNNTTPNVGATKNWTPLASFTLTAVCPVQLLLKFWIWRHWRLSHFFPSFVDLDGTEVSACLESLVVKMNHRPLSSDNSPAWVIAMEKMLVMWIHSVRMKCHTAAHFFFLLHCILETRKMKSFCMLF